MKTALLNDDSVKASIFDAANPPPASGLKCPACKKGVYWRPQSAARVAHFAHLLAKGSCVNEDGERRPRAVNAARVDELRTSVLFRPRNRPQRARRRAAVETIEIVPAPAREPLEGRPNIPRVIVRNARDAAAQERHILNALDGDQARQDVRIEIDGKDYPWSSFYFRSTDYASIWSLHLQEQLPPIIAIEAERDTDPGKIENTDRIACKPIDDERNGLRFTVVVENRAALEIETFNPKNVVLGVPTVRPRSGNRWVFVDVGIRLDYPDDVALAP